MGPAPASQEGDLVLAVGAVLDVLLDDGVGTVAEGEVLLSELAGEVHEKKSHSGPV